MAKCQLCDCESVLLESHIIPRSFLKSVKSGESQLYVFQEGKQPKCRNVNPTEQLFCASCESFLSTSYEQYGTSLLKNPKKVIKHRNCIEFKNFEYRKWYLFYLSILWRASISSIAEYSDIDLGDFNIILKECVLTKNLQLFDGLSIDDVLEIIMFRVVDKTSRFEDDALKSVMLSPVRLNDGEDVLFFFMANGFLVQYRLNKTMIEQLRFEKVRRTDADRNNQRFVRKLDITESAFLVDNFNWLVESVKS